MNRSVSFVEAALDDRLPVRRAVKEQPLVLVAAVLLLDLATPVLEARPHLAVLDLLDLDDLVGAHDQHVVLVVVVLVYAY